MRELHAKAEEEAKEANERREEAERDVLKQLDSNKALLEKLLAEQRETLSTASKELQEQVACMPPWPRPVPGSELTAPRPWPTSPRRSRLAPPRDPDKQLTTETAQRHAATTELIRLREESERTERELRSEVTKLKEEIKKLRTPPPKKEKPRPKGMIDLDESEGAPPYSEQVCVPWLPPC